MAAVKKIDGNATGLRVAREQTLGVLPGTPDWEPEEPNSYGDFGPTVGKVARQPIAADRQLRRDVEVDLDVSASFSTDVTQENLTDRCEEFFFAALRKKDELAVANVDTGDTSDDYEPASGGDGYVAGDLLFAQGFTDAANNGLAQVTGTPTATSVTVTKSLTPAAGQSGTLRRVGFQFASGDATIDASGTLPQLKATTKDLTTLGLIPGEWIFIGGDAAGEQFATAANNGFARVRSVAAGAITLDKAESTLVTDAGASKTIRVFFAPRVIKNESDSTLIVRSSVQLERSLGAPDDASPAQIQAEYAEGAIASELTLNIATADKMTADLSYVATGYSTIDGPTSLKTGNRPAIVSADAFNTSSDIRRIKMAPASSTDENPTALNACLENVAITVANNLEALKGVGKYGAFEVSTGFFQVTAQVAAYFNDVASLDAVLNNTDITLDEIIVKNNKGINIDLPMTGLGDGGLSVEGNQAVTQEFTMNASTASSLDAGLDHTMLVGWWDYLPNLAAPA